MFQTNWELKSQLKDLPWLELKLERWERTTFPRALCQYDLVLKTRGLEIRQNSVQTSALVLTSHITITDFFFFLTPLSLSYLSIVSSCITYLFLHNTLLQTITAWNHTHLLNSVSVGLESGPYLLGSSASESLTRLQSKCQPQLRCHLKTWQGKDSLPSSLTCLLAEYRALLAVG